MSRYNLAVLSPLFALLPVACAVESDPDDIARGPARITDALTLDEVEIVAQAIARDLDRVEALRVELEHDPDALVEAVQAIDEARLDSLEGLLDDALVDEPTAGDLAELRARHDLAPIAGGLRIDEGLHWPETDEEELVTPPWSSSGGTWGSSTATWCFEDDEDGTADLDNGEVFFSASIAAAQWGASSALYLERRADCGSANIRIGFHTGYHWDVDWAGDTSSFDGRGGTLAHAFAPSLGYLHFDDAETWTRASRGTTAQPIDLDSVMTHELGHALGLGHSTTGTATMWPFYMGSAMRTLDSDDIAGISARYGSRTSNCLHTYLQAYVAKSEAYTLYSHVYADFRAGVASYADYNNAYLAYVYTTYAQSYALSAYRGDIAQGDYAAWAMSLATPYLEDVGIASRNYAAAGNWGDNNLDRALKAHYYAHASVITGEACADGR